MNLNNSNETLNKVQEAIRDIAYEAGEILLKFQKKRSQLYIQDKGVDGIVSSADFESEKYIVSQIERLFPGVMILSEESINDDETFLKAQKADYCWVIDPLDGTNNFLNGIPIYAVSIGLLNLGAPILGVVYNPTSGECFFSYKGSGSHLIDFRINPFKVHELKSFNNNKEMSDCIFSPAPIYEDTPKFEQQLSVFRKNISGARALRRLGSAALEICYVASGNFDGYWEKNLKPWDVAAAGIICLEAGVSVTNFNAQPFTPFDQSIIAAFNPLHSKILGEISQNY